MRRMITVCFMMLIAAYTANAQPAGYQAVTDMISFSTRLDRSAKSLQSFRADFTQEKNLAAIEETVISKGTFLFKKPGRLRMEYVQPFRYLMVIGDGKVTIRDGQKTNSFSSRGNKLFTVVNQIIIDCMQGTVLSNKDFTPGVYENEKHYMVKLVPVKKDLRNYFESITVILSKNQLEVYQITMKEPSGDQSVITFSNRQNNASIPDSDFVVR